MNIRTYLPAILVGILIVGSSAYFMKDTALDWWHHYRDAREVRFHFITPETYGNDTPYPGGDIYVNGYSPNMKNMPWGTICDPSMDTDPSPTALDCTVKLPKGATLIGQVSMAVADAQAGMIHLGDESYTNFGGRGRLLGGLGVCADGTPIPIMLTPAPSWSDPNPEEVGEPGELRTYNFMIQL